MAYDERPLWEVYNDQPKQTEVKEAGIIRPKYRWADEVLREQANRPKAKVSPLLEDWLKEKGISLDCFAKTKKAK